MNSFLASLPRGTFRDAFYAQLPYAHSMKEACDRAYSYLIMQHTGSIRLTPPSPVEVCIGTRPPLDYCDGTEKMPAVVRERRLRWRPS